MLEASHVDLATFARVVEVILNQTASAAIKVIEVRRALVELHSLTEHRVHPVNDTCAGLVCGCQG